MERKESQSKNRTKPDRIAKEEQSLSLEGARRTSIEMSILAEIGRVISSSVDLDKVYESFASQAKKLIHFDRTSVNLINHSNRTRTLAYIAGLDIPGLKKGDTLPLKGSMNESVVRTHRGVILQSVRGEDLVAQYPRLLLSAQKGVRSIMCVPLISKNKVIGTLFFHSKRKEAYTERDLRLAEKIARQIAGAVANAQLYADLMKMDASLRKLEEDQRRQREIAERLANENAIIAEIGRVIGSTLDIEEVYERFVMEAKKLILTDRVLVSLNDPDGETRTVAYIFGLEVRGRKPGDVSPMAGTPNEMISRTRKGLIIQSVNGDELVARFPSLELAVRAGIRSFMAVPLISLDNLIGTLVFEAIKPDAYNEQDLDLAERIGSQISGAIANGKLYSDLREAGRRLQESEKELRETLANLERMVQERTVELEEINTALKVLIKRGGEDQKQLGENMQANINQLVVPFLKKLRVTQSDKQSLAYLNILETNLNEIASPFINHLSTAYNSLTPKEIKIAVLIKEGRMSKEIAMLMGVSVGTIITHRNNIRRKLHLKSKGTNLRSHLISLM